MKGGFSSLVATASVYWTEVDEFNPQSISDSPSLTLLPLANVMPLIRCIEHFWWMEKQYQICSQLQVSFSSKLKLSLKCPILRDALPFQLQLSSKENHWALKPSEAENIHKAPFRRTHSDGLWQPLWRSQRGRRRRFDFRCKQALQQKNAAPESLQLSDANDAKLDYAREAHVHKHPLGWGLSPRMKDMLINSMFVEHVNSLKFHSEIPTDWNGNLWEKLYFFPEHPNTRSLTYGTNLWP